MRVQQDKTLSWSSTESHPSDKNKNARWMGHSFIPRGPAKPADDQREAMDGHPPVSEDALGGQPGEGHMIGSGAMVGGAGLEPATSCV